jgi:hypothetical protein
MLKRYLFELTAQEMVTCVVDRRHHRLGLWTSLSASSLLMISNLRKLLGTRILCRPLPQAQS